MVTVQKKPRPIRLFYHIGWRTKYKKPVITSEIANFLFELFQNICDKNNYILDKVGIRPTHVHQIISIPPTIPIAQAVKNIKGASAKTILEKFPSLVEQIGKRALWQREYYAETLGKPINVLRVYLAKKRNQPESIWLYKFKKEDFERAEKAA